MSFAQRSALVRTDAVQREEFSIHIEERHDRSLDDEFARLAGGKVFNSTDTNPITHSFFMMRQHSG